MVLAFLIYYIIAKQSSFHAYDGGDCGGNCVLIMYCNVLYSIVLYRNVLSKSKDNDSLLDIHNAISILTKLS